MYAAEVYVTLDLLSKLPTRHESLMENILIANQCEAIASKQLCSFKPPVTPLYLQIIVYIDYFFSLFYPKINVCGI